MVHLEFEASLSRRLTAVQNIGFEFHLIGTEFYKRIPFYFLSMPSYITCYFT